MFDMRRLRHALALAEHRNFARAAAALHITQPALSRSIQALEEGMGVLLFDRSPRDVEPTAFGELVLRHARGLASYEAQQRTREWRRQPVAAARHRVLVLGRGEIGRAVATTLQALGFGVACWHTQAGPLAAMLAEADIVVNTLPLTPGTSGLLDARAFAAMPRGAYLVNIARGGHVVEPDLIAAVNSGHLSGAALDVQQTEPMPADDPLWAVPGISITPHIAAQPSWRTMAQQFAQGRACLARGEAPPNLVDRSRGY